MEYTKFGVKPISGAMGAEVFDIDLSKSLDNSTVDEIHGALSEYVVLLFRNQNLSVKQHRAFASRFGKLIPHPYVTGVEEDPDLFEIVREPGEPFSWDNYYHSDLMFLETPPIAGALYGAEVPPYGADTDFRNSYLAYETLSEEMQRMLEPLEGVNESGDTKQWSEKYQGMHEQKNEPQSATHPIVRVHPETGRKGLFLSPAFTTRFKGMTVSESEPLLSFLYNHSIQTHFGCRLHWQPGSLALWDNRFCLHHAVADYFGEMAKHRRVMRRATIEGEKPIGVSVSH